jgi:hypothetical protein
MKIRLKLSLVIPMLEFGNDKLVVRYDPGRAKGQGAGRSQRFLL